LSSAPRSVAETVAGSDVEGAAGAGDPWIGRVIAHRYKVVERLAEGGMGTVYIAEHLTLGKEVALKTIHPDLAGDEELAERFAREAMATAKLEHPHVASALDYGRLPEGGAFLVMQLVRGPSLHDVLDREGRVSWPRACAIGAQVADALAAAHGVGIIHRDLKPENVLLEPRDDGSELVKVLDFGIARIGDDVVTTMSTRTSGHRLTRRGTVMGTPGYMAPEQALGEAIDARADIYALGILLWESIAGQALWSGETLTDIVAEQLGGKKIAALRETSGDPTLPAELETLIGQMLSRHPDERPESAAVVRDRLRDLALRASVAGARVTPPAGLVALQGLTEAPALPAASPPPAPDPAGEAWRGGARRTPWVLLGALALLLFLGTGIYLWRASPPSPEQDPALMREIFERAQAATRAEELNRQIGLLLHEDSRDLRRAASSYILDYEPADEVPDRIRALAQLELASGCDNLRAALEAVREAGDPSLREAVERRFPLVWRRGMRRDLYRCVRGQVGALLDAWQGAAAESE